mmetsp:Transcript_12103/g.38687  ORF Transcript_12103/g.38687 Transcript_12103/m.38687 type:complete len:263 (-) Transcript_12103:28-816(-)
MRPGRSCRSAKCTAIWWNTGCSSFSRLAMAALSLAASSPDAPLSCASSSWSLASTRCAVATTSLARYLTDTQPGASSTPPRASVSAYISIWSGLMVGSTTTHAPPRSSANGGRYTNTGCLYATSASTMLAPNLRTWSNMSRWPPENPRQLAKMMSGSSSRLKSLMACAVLNAESGNHTWPAWFHTRSWLSGAAGSAGLRASTVRISEMTTPMGTLPSRARPVITVLAQPARHSTHELRSKNPDTQRSGSASSILPSSSSRGS